MGAGGCVLSTWLCALAPAACVTAVELSSGVADAARDCFGAATVRTPRPLCFTLSHLPPPPAPLHLRCFPAHRMMFGAKHERLAQHECADQICSARSTCQRAPPAPLFLNKTH
eukprot:SAG25_NODE_1591_length_2721_cov_1.887109_2_plen_113_part_00